MKILSVDTCSKVCSVALLEDTDILYEKNLNSGLTHSENLMPMIKEAFDKTKLQLSDIDLFAVCKGPGSFTGIRIGVSTIQAFVDVLKKPAIGICSLDSLAYHMTKEGYVASLMDARNEQVYAALYLHKDSRYTLVSDYMADSIDTVMKQLQKCTKDPFCFVGDASLIHQEKLIASFSQASFGAEEDNIMKASFTGKAAFDKYHNSTISIQEKSISPFYLRKSQAERMQEKKEES